MEVDIAEGGLGIKASTLSLPCLEVCCDLFGCVPVETQHETQLHWSQVRLLLQICKPIASLYLETSVVLDERESYYKANAFVCTTCVFSQVCSQSLGLPENLGVQNPLVCHHVHNYTSNSLGYPTPPRWHSLACVARKSIAAITLRFHARQCEASRMRMLPQPIGRSQLFFRFRMDMFTFLWLLINHHTQTKVT